MPRMGSAWYKCATNWPSCSAYQTNASGLSPPGRWRQFRDPQCNLSGIRAGRVGRTAAAASHRLQSGSLGGLSLGFSGPGPAYRRRACARCRGKFPRATLGEYGEQRSLYDVVRSLEQRRAVDAKRLPHSGAHVVARAAVTNTPATIPYRSAGRPEAIYAIERLIDLAARQCGFNRIALRRRNIMVDRSSPTTIRSASYTTTATMKA